MDVITENRINQIGASISDLKRVSSGDVRGIATVDAATLLASIEEALAKIHGEDALVKTGALLLSQTDGIFTFIEEQLQKRAVAATTLRIDSSAASMGDGGLRAAVDIVFAYLVGAERFMKAAELVFLVRTCIELLQRTAAGKGLSAFQEALFNPIKHGVILAQAKGVSASALGVPELIETLLKMTGTASVKRVGKSVGSQKVRKNALELLGLLTKEFPAETANRAIDVHKAFKTTLAQVVNSEQPEFTVAVGVLDGLSYFFHHYADHDEPDWTGVVYNFMVRGLELTDHTRHEVPRAALRLLRYHAKVFRAQLAADVRMADRLKTLVNHRNVDVHKTALHACSPYAATVAAELADPGSAVGEKERRQVFRELLAKARAFAGTEGGATHVTSFGVILLGHLCHATARFAGDNAVLPIVEILVSRFKELYGDSGAGLAAFLSDESRASRPTEAGGGELAQDYVRLLPAFVNSLAAAVLSVVDVPTPLEAGICDYVRIIWLHYPRKYIFDTTRASLNTAVLHLFLACYQKGDLLTRVLQATLFQTLTLTISPMSAFDESIASELHTGETSIVEGARADATATESRADGTFANQDLDQGIWGVYLPLWTVILSAKSAPARTWEYPWNRLIGLSAGEHAHLTSIVFDATATTTLQLFDAFDLSLHPESTDATPVASCPKDFELYLNLVSFWCRLFHMVSDTSVVADWSVPLAMRFTELSENFPHVSGFYRLLATVVERVERVGYLHAGLLKRDKSGDVSVANDGDGKKDEEDEEAVAALPAAGNQEKPSGRARELVDLLLRYTAVTVEKIPELKGELLVSAVAFLLSLPVYMVNLKQMVTPLRIALTTGLSFPPIAAIAITSLESWLDLSPVTVRKHIVDDVVSVLQFFISAAHTRTIDSPSTGGKQSRGSKKLPTGIRYGLRYYDGADFIGHFPGFDFNWGAADEVQKLREIQIRVVTILGKLGSGVARRLLSADGEEKEDDGGFGQLGLSSVIPWDVKERIVVKLPFGDVRRDVAFDKALPKVCELALTSNDRKTKAAACELLHALVVWTVGANAYSPHRNPNPNNAATNANNPEAGNIPAPGSPHALSPNPTPFHSIYQKVFPVIARLAVDPEPIAQQLFSKLLIQLVHWFTGNVHYESKETMALLDCLLSGLASPSNSALRDMCAMGCAEFVKYSIRHGPDTAMRNAASIMTRLHTLSLHPRTWTRRGASTAYSRILTEMYASDDLLAGYLMHSIFTGILSLALEDQSDHEAEGNRAIVGYLGKAEKMVVRRVKLLLSKSDKRRGHLPSPARSLENLVGWLLDQSFFEDRWSRRWAMRLFLTFSSCLPGFDDTDQGPKKWLAHALKDRGGVDGVLLFIEQRMRPLPRDPNAPQKFTPEGHAAWAVEIETCADAHYWLVAHGLIEPVVGIFADDSATESESGGDEPPSKKRKTGPKPRRLLLPVHVEAFLRHAVVDGLPFRHEAGGERLLTPKQREAAWKKTQRALEAVVPLAVLSLESPESSVAPRSMHSKGYLLALACMLLRPKALGYDPHAARTQTIVPRLAKTAMQAILQGSDARIKADLIAAVSAVLKRKECDPFGDDAADHFIIPDKTESLADVLIVLRGCRALHRLSILRACVEKVHRNLKTDGSLATVLSGALSVLPVDFLTTPGTRLVVTELWKLTFELGLGHEQVLALLTDRTPLSREELATTRISKSFSTLLPAGPSAVSNPTSQQQQHLPATPLKGDMFYTTHRAEICEYILLNPDPVLTEIAGLPALHRVLVDATTLCRTTPDTKAAAKFAAVASKSVVPLICESAIAAVKQWQKAKDGGGKGRKEGAKSGSVLSWEWSDRVATALTVVANVIAVDDGAVVKGCPEAVGWTSRLAVALFSLEGTLALPSAALQNVSRSIRVLAPFLLRLRDRIAHPTATPGPSSPNKPQQASATAEAALRSLVANQLPVHHSEAFQENSHLRDAYISVVDALMAALIDSRSVTLLTTIIPLIRGTGRHPLGDVIGGSLRAFFANLPESTTLQCADACVEQFLNFELPPDVRYAATNRLCVLALQRLKTGSLIQFFSQHVARLYAVASGEWPPSDDDEECLSSLLSRTSVFVLFELMYRLCPGEATKTAINAHFASAVGQTAGIALTGKEMNDKVIRGAHAGATAPLPFSEESIRAACEAAGVPAAAAVLKFRQAAFNCLASALVATQTNPSLITRALFLPRAGHAVWENVVDLRRPYVFDVETNFQFARSAVQRVRSEWEAEALKEEGVDPAAKRYAALRRSSYVSTQYLAGTSLATAAPLSVLPHTQPGADNEHAQPQLGSASPFKSQAGKPPATQHQHGGRPAGEAAFAAPGAPFSVRRHKEILSQTDPELGESPPDPNPGPKPSPGAASGDRSHNFFGSQNLHELDSQGPPVLVPGQLDGDIEMDAINRSPIMPTLLRVVLFLKKLEVQPSREPPDWMAEMLSKVSNPSTEKNVKLIIAKIVLNAPELFREFATLWVAPLIDVALDTHLPEHVPGGINYFVRDVAIVLLSWNEDIHATSFEVEARASAFLEKLIKGCGSPHRRILAANLELIKAFVEGWKDRIRVGPEHKRAILGWVSYPPTVPKQTLWVKSRITGLQLLGVLIANGLKPFDTFGDVSVSSEDEFYSRICANLPPYTQGSALSTDLIRTASEVVGMIYNQASVLNQPCDPLKQRVSKKLRSLHAQGSYEQFLLVLSGIVRHNPPAADEFLPHTLLRMLPHAKGAYKGMVLEVIAQRVDHFPATYSEFHPFIMELLTTESDEVKLLTFNLIQKALTATNDPKDVISFITNVSADIKTRLLPVGSLSLDAKVALYDTWIKIFDTQWDLLTPPARVAISDHLLSGLQEEATYIRDRLLRFLDNPTRLPVSAFKRLERLFTPSHTQLSLYSPALGDRWLQYSCILLLFLSHRSAEFQDKTAFFRDQLASCEYIDMPVLTSVEHRSVVTLTPMFASSIGGGTQGSQGMIGSQPGGTSTGDHGGDAKYSGGKGVQGRPGAGQLLATLHGSVAPATQMPGEAAATNFAHYEPRRSAASQFALSQTAMLFQPFPAGQHAQGGRGRGKAAMGPPPNEVLTSRAGAYLPHLVQRPAGLPPLRRRFLKSREEQRITQSAMSATESIRQSQDSERKFRQSSASTVKMWRSYREGEVPDIQLSPSSILLPLEALCLYDADVARTVLTSVFKCMFLSLSSPEGTNPDSSDPIHSILGPLSGTVGYTADRGRIKQSLSHAVVHMLSGMKRSTGVVSFLHTTLLDDELAVDTELVAPEVVYESAVLSRNLRTGALLLEQGILKRSSRMQMIEAEVKRASAVYTAKELQGGNRSDSMTSMGSAGGSSGEEKVGGESARLREKKSALEEARKSDAKAWALLVALYGFIGDEDAALGVIQDRLLSGTAADAVSKVISQRYDAALSSLDAILSQKTPAPLASFAGTVKLPESDIRHLLEAERQKCMKHLLDWNALSVDCDRKCPISEPSLWPSSSDAQVPNAKAKGLSELSRTQLLVNHVLSKARLGQRHSDLCAFLKGLAAEAMEDRLKMDIILSERLCLPLALLAVQTFDNSMARRLVDWALQGTLDAWTSLPATQRTYGEVHRIVAALQPIVEVDEYLKLVLRAEQGKDVGLQGKRLLFKWSRRTSAFEGDVLEWDALANSRAVLCTLLQHSESEWAREAAHGVSVAPEEVNRHKCAVLLHAATALQNQGLTGPARAFLHQYAEAREAGSIGEDASAADPAGAVVSLDIEFIVIAVRNSIDRAKHARTPEQAGKLYRKTVQYVQSENEKHRISDHHPVQYHLLTAECHKGMAEHLSSMHASEAEAHVKNALKHHQAAAGRATEQTQSRVRALEELGLFADTILSEKKLETGLEAVAGLLVRSYLSAILISGGTVVSRIRLPRALEVAEIYPSAKEILVSLVAKIDSWHLLPWVSQIVGYIGSKTIGDVAVSLLYKPCRRFPQHVFYAVNASGPDLEKLAYTDDTLKQRLAALHAHIREGLTSSGALEAGDKHQPVLLESFVTALERTHNPDLRFKYWIDEIVACLRDHSSGAAHPGFSQSKLSSLWSGMVTDLFDLQETDASDTSLNKKFAAASRKKTAGGLFLQAPDDEGATPQPAGRKPKQKQNPGAVPLFEDVEGHLKPLVRNLADASAKSIEAACRRSREWQAAVKAHWTHARLSGPVPLSYYSPWLAEYRFSWSSPDNIILLPQQPFLHLHNPTPVRLPDVASFNQTALVMPSIQKPKKIIFRCTDEREYPFLVKGGEDLRQDQRIQQLFYVFNSCMQGDTRCSSRGVFIKGYAVMPLSQQVGLVQWVDDCKPMKSLIESQMGGIAGVQSHPAAKKHHEFVASAARTGNWALGFRALYGEYGKTDLTQKYAELASEIDEGYLKRAIASLCAHHAAFYDSRNRFTASLAAASIGQWVLGIGDRHLDNFLVDSKTAAIIPIDFGHAFGTATELLHIPELMPMRITPQMQALWKPLGATLVTRGMVACLESLRKNTRLVLDVLSVFIREPLSTWQRTAARKAKKKPAGDAASAAESAEKPQHEYAAAKIDCVRRKLSLANPWTVMYRDLTGNSVAMQTTLAHPQGLQNAKAILKGRPGVNIRADAPATCTSTEQQVECLIDMATDPNILCRTYMGWAPLF
ncbi:DNA-dependent protein kinase catalytic subunit [Diplonema papillatum]|nr:DNA-dependent protein kinase catalytic subunit [Diplonema papillatum]